MWSDLLPYAGQAGKAKVSASKGRTYLGLARLPV